MASRKLSPLKIVCRKAIIPRLPKSKKSAKMAKILFSSNTVLLSKYPFVSKQLLLLQEKVLSGIPCQREDARIHPYRVTGTGFDTVTAKDTLKRIDRKSFGHLLIHPIGAFRRLDEDAV